jgi:hypothetical protein
MSENLSEQQKQPEQPSNGEDSTLQQTEPEVDYRRSNTFLSMYANSTQVRTTPWDIQLTFGEIFSIEPQKVVIENQLAVTLSPQQAKALANTLSDQVQKYESNFGEIRYTPIQPQTEDPSQPQRPTNTPQVPRSRRRLNIEADGKET